MTWREWLGEVSGWIGSWMRQPEHQDPEGYPQGGVRGIKAPTESKPPAPPVATDDRK